MTDRAARLFNTLDAGMAVLISSYPNIFYYSGFTSGDAFLLMTENERFIITDSRYFVQAREQAVGFELVDIAEGFGKIFAKISEKTIGFEDACVSVERYEKLCAALGEGQELKKLQEKINAPRRTKDEDEIKKIAEAERLGDEAFSYILTKIKTGVTEAEIAFELEFFMKRNGASALSFETIAASGKRGAMPHGTASKKVIEHGDMLTLDFGCVLEGYCSDMTRTVAVGTAAPWQHEVYNTVLKAQLAALSFIEAGKSCAEADSVARQIITDAGYGKNFGHSLGHSVGIEIHENPNLSPKSTDIIENGNVLTVEPGIYIDGMGGVRIEDLTAIVNGKAVNLTHSDKGLIIL